jgi:hypothetical protein
LGLQRCALYSPGQGTWERLEPAALCGAGAFEWRRVAALLLVLVLAVLVLVLVLFGACAGLLIRETARSNSCKPPSNALAGGS